MEQSSESHSPSNTQEPQALNLENYKCIVFLTGAGISKASGLPTYRGEGGVWNSQNVLEYATKEAIERDPVKVWQAFREMYHQSVAAEPNAAHRAIAGLQDRLGEKTWVCVLTQNVDGLHKLADTSSLLEGHGSLRRLRCSECARDPWPTETVHHEQAGILPDTPPPCPDCGGRSRFDVVLFGEELPPNLPLQIMAFMGGCDLFIAVGTSGLVAPASQLVDMANDVGARTICVNTQAGDERFDETILGKAEELLPFLLGGR